MPDTKREFRCQKCLVIQELPAGGSTNRRYCPPCKQEVLQAKWHRQDLGRRESGYYGTTERRHRATARRYSMPLETLMEWYERGTCDCCGEAADALMVDHDHSCCPGIYACGKCVRGILCRSCNVLAGWLERQPTRLANVVAYLESTEGGVL